MTGSGCDAVGRPAITRAIVPAAGLGTRLLPLTLGVAKELLPLGRHPALVATLLEAAAAGVRELVVVSSPGKEGLPRFLHGFELCRDFAIQIIEQPSPVGVLDAVERALPAPFDVKAPPVAVLFPDLVHLPDQTALVRLVAAYERCGAALFGLRLFSPASSCAPTTAVKLDEPLQTAAQLDEARASGRPLRIRGIGPARGVPGELLTTFGQLHSPALQALIEVHCRPAGDPSRPLDDGKLLLALGELAARGGLYGVLLDGEILDVGNLPGYLDAAGRFLRGAARLRGLS
jgi:UTP--glucose-1-phosphate uridylyltransferase